MKALFQGYYEGKTVFVTGHTGFKGAWLTFWLLQLGATVVGFSKEVFSEPNLFTLLNLQSQIIHLEGDICDHKLLEKSLREYSPDVVFHLAAQSLVRESYVSPLETLRTNVMGTAILLECLRELPSLKSAIMVTSDKCYAPPHLPQGYRESDPMGGDDLYSASKGCAELVTHAYRHSFYQAVPIATVRAGNVIGGGDWSKDRLIPDAIRALCDNQDIVIRYPQAVRPWQWVLEPLSGYLWLGYKLSKSPSRFSSGWNFGPRFEETLSVETVVQKVVSHWGSGGYRVDAAPALHEAASLTLNLTHTQAELGWNPVCSVHEALEATVSWYQTWHTAPDTVLSFSINQLNQYIQAASNKGALWSSSYEIS